MSYHIEDGEQFFDELPEKILVRKNGWYGAYRFYGEPWVDYWYVPERTCQMEVLNTSNCAAYECSEYIMHCHGCGHEFGHVLYNEDGDVWMSELPNYCPNCGARIEAGEASVGDTPTSDDADIRQGLVTLEMTFARRKEEGD